jgi:hypothetical protein
LPRKPPTDTNITKVINNFAENIPVFIHSGCV